MDHESKIESIHKCLNRIDARQLIIHCVNNQPNLTQLGEMVRGLGRYAERGLLLARQTDVVCLNNSVDSEYVSFLQSIGFPISIESILVAPPPTGQSTQPLARSLLACPTLLKSLQSQVNPSDGLILNCHMTTRFEQDLADELSASSGNPVISLHGSWKSIQYYNSKRRGRELAQSLGIPIAPGQCVDLRKNRDGEWNTSPLRKAGERWSGLTGSVIIRGDIGASGSEVYRINDDASMTFALERIRHGQNGTYLVEAMFPLVRSPNVSLYIDPSNGQIDCMGISDQLLANGSVHCGNSYPSTTRHIDRLLRYSTLICEQLREVQVSGFIGIDFCETAIHSDLDPIFFAEINPRVNGALYAKAILDRMVEKCDSQNMRAPKAVVSTEFASDRGDFAELTRRFGQHWLTATSGIIPYNVGCLSEGKCSLAILGTDLNECQSIYREFTQLATRSNVANKRRLLPKIGRNAA